MKRTYPLLLLITACLAVSCGKGDDDPSAGVPNPGKDVAGYLAGTYQVSTVLSSATGSSIQSPGAMTGSGSITLTRVNDSTLVYRNQTELTITATGKKFTLTEEVNNCSAEYLSSYGIINLGQPVGSSVLSIGQLLSKKRLMVSRYKQQGYDVSIEYQR